MLNQDKTKIKMISISRKNKNVKKVIGVVRGLKQPKVTKSNSDRKDSNAEIRNKRFKNSKNPKKKFYYKNAGEDFGLKKSKNHTFKTNPSPGFYKNDLSGGNPRSKLNSCLGANLHKRSVEKASLLNTIFKCSKDFTKSSSSNPIFVSLSNTEEGEKHKNKFRKPATERKLRRLREDLWRKSSYHQRFLGKPNTVMYQKTQKIKNKKVKKKRKIRPTPSRKKDLNSVVQKSIVKNPMNDKCKACNESTGKKNPEQNTVPNKASGQDDLVLKTETKINMELPQLDSQKPSKEDISTIDESYMKSLLLIANCTTKPENMESKKSCNNEPETETKLKITGQEFFVRKMKNKKNLENKTDCTSFTESNGMKHQRNFTKESNDSSNLSRDATKSETQVKLWKRKLPEVKKGIKHMPKKSYSKHEIKNYQQKKKTRNIVKNKTEDTVEMPFPCEVQKTNEVRELWKKENFKTLQSCDSSLTIAEIVNDGNHKTLGLESYQTLKNFVEEELQRISRMSNKNMGIQEKGTFKQQNATPNERQLSELVRKKLTAKSRESFLQDEKPSRNPEIIQSVNPSLREKVEKIKSKLKLMEENYKPIKVIPDEVIRNWSIVNRLEQAFLALGTPDFRKINEKKLATTNTKAARTIERATAEKKKIEKKIKDAEKREKKPATQTVGNKQKTTELNKTCLNEKQLNVLHKKESTKPDTPLSTSSKRSSITDRRTKPKEDAVPSQPAGSRKPWLKRTVKTANKTLSKPTTPVQNLFSTRNEFLNITQNGKLGKENSPRNLLCESTTQNITADDSLERKKTFPIISLKDSIIMQPRRSKSCNKIDGCSEVARKNSLPSTRKQECEKLNPTNLQKQNQDFFDYFKTVKEFKIQDLSDLERSSSENIVQIFERPGNSSDTPGGLKNINSMGTSSNEAYQVNKWDKTAPVKLTKNVRTIKDKSDGNKVRAIKERSILSIRSKQHENQTSRTNISQIKEEIDNLRLLKASIRKSEVKVDVFLPPTSVCCSQTSWTSTGTYDLTESENNDENNEQITTSANELERKPSPSINIPMVSSHSLSKNNNKTKIRNAPWEKDIRYYRALVKEIMSQYKRLDGFLKQTGNIKTSPENSTELNMSNKEEEVDTLNKRTNIKEYRKKIKQEYQEVPIFEYKSQMQKIQGKPDDKRKQRNLLVVKATNAEVDLDVKDYEPRLRMISGSGLYFDKENIMKNQRTKTNLRGGKISLYEVISCKHKKPVNFSKVLYTPRSCVILSHVKKIGPSQSNPEEKCSDFAPDLSKL